LVGVKLVVGSWILPNTTRLQVYKQDEVIAPFNFTTLSNTTNKSGMLFLVTFDISSNTPTFMEGCIRAIIDDEPTFLSSGTEDFFLSAYYFNEGEYRGFQSGLTFKREDGYDNFTKIVAYKLFLDDPILFRKSFQLVWRNNEELGGVKGCPNKFPPNLEGEGLRVKFSDRMKKTGPFPINPSDAYAHIQSYVWVYEW
jgi:hypothetical protein